MLLLSGSVAVAYFWSLPPQAANNAITDKKNIDLAQVLLVIGVIEGFIGGY